MYTLQQLADRVGGQVAGDPQTPIAGLHPFETAKPGDLTLAQERRYLARLESTLASAVIVPEGAETPEKPLLLVDKPKVAFARLMQLFYGKEPETAGISPLAQVGKNCRMGDNVTLYPYVWVGDEVTLASRVTLYPGVVVGHHCSLGPGCLLYPGVVLYEHVRLGARVVIHAGSVIGADGFGYVFDGREQVKIPQTGGVVIGDDVEIGANSCVDRATFGDTVLERGVKLDNHVHVGHNCRIGENTVIVAQVGISGSVEIGKNCTFGGHAGVIDHVKIGDHVTVMVKSAVTRNVPSQRAVSGQPAIDHRRALKIEALTRRLPELYAQWRRQSRGNRSEGKK